MIKQSEHTGFAIAIAWPQTYCKQPGSWYDSITSKLGFNINNYYKAGHAAIILINSNSKECFYFDFGRYHSPFQHGRVRSVNTDDDLAIKTKATISKSSEKIENLTEILTELQKNPSCHGDGKIIASYCSINFQSAFNEANKMLEQDAIRYGPFHSNGSNCSRFVNTTILAGKPSLKYLLRLKYWIFITPTPMNNINSLENKTILPVFLKHKPFTPKKRLSIEQINNTLLQPIKHPNIPKNAQWLSGEGAGSWFDFTESKGKLIVTRYSPAGQTECKGLFENKKKHFSSNEIKISYPSNCKKITLTNSSETFEIHRICI